ncbi:hypothetical protein GCM10009646_49910 [Streptomyces aureus]
MCRGAGLGAERPGPRTCHDEALRGELRERARHGHRAHPEPFDESPTGRQLSTWRVAIQLPPQPFRQFTHTATLMHEDRE